MRKGANIAAGLWTSDYQKDFRLIALTEPLWTTRRLDQQRGELAE
jgi:hypothetical protein